MIPRTEKSNAGSIRFLVDEMDLKPAPTTDIPHEVGKKLFTMTRRYGVSYLAAVALYNGQAEYLDRQGKPI